MLVGRFPVAVAREGLWKREHHRREEQYRARIDQERHATVDIGEYTTEREKKHAPERHECRLCEPWS